MKSFKAMAHIHSLGGAMDEVTILDRRQEADHVVYIVDYKGVKCTAIFNWLANAYYADNKYGIIKED